VVFRGAELREQPQNNVNVRTYSSHLHRVQTVRRVLFFAGPGAYPMADTWVTPENHVSNWCVAKWFEAQSENGRAETNFSKRAPEVLGREGHASTDVVSIRELGGEISTTWARQVSRIEDWRPNPDHEGPASDDTGRGKFDNGQKHGKVVQRDLNELIYAFCHDEKRERLRAVPFMTRLHSEHCANGRK
jgi:hypothetical protein